MTGGAASTLGGGGTAPNDMNLSDVTQDQWTQINSSSCLGWTAEGEMVPANIEFVVDTSGSMSQVAPNTTDGKTKWEITRNALQNAIDSLPRLTSVGMLLWPNQVTVPNTWTTMFQDGVGISSCVAVSKMVPMAPLNEVGSVQRMTLKTALDAADVRGGTPMADAYSYAIENNFGNHPLMVGNKYAVLITDGQPTIDLGCMGTGETERPYPPNHVQELITAAHTAAVNTFIIGSPGSEDQSGTGVDGRGWLSDAAQLGGTKASGNCVNTGPNYCHFDMSQVHDFAAGFTAALQNITGQILDCKYKINDSQLNGQLLDIDKLNVVYEINGQEKLGSMKLVGKAASPACTEGNGWFIDPVDPAGKTISLCPTTCQLIQSDAGAVVSIRGGCTYIVPIN